MLDSIQAAVGCPALDVLAVVVSSLANGGIVWIALGLVLCVKPAYRRAGIAVLVALVLATLLGQVLLKSIIMRPRPCDVNPSFPLLISRPLGSSFPSGHTAASFAAAAALVASRVPRPLWVSAGVLAVLIALSRLYLYVHFPTDVAAGAVLGVVCGVAGAWLAPRLQLWGRRVAVRFRSAE